MADYVEVILALKNVSQFVSGSKQASGAIAQVGTETEKTGKKATLGWKGLAKWAGGAAAMYAAAKFVRGAVDATTDLAKSTLAVQRATNLDTQTASEWAALTKERGISTRQFQLGLKTLSVQMEKSRTGTADTAAKIGQLRRQIDQVAAAGGKKAPAELAKLSRAIASAQGAGEKSRKTLQALGVSTTELAKGDTANVLYDVADALQHMQRGSERTALATKLFGRSGQMLLPILMRGREGVRELLDEQKQAGNYLSGKNLNDTKKLIEQQRALRRAYMGVKVQLGTALLPVLTSVGQVIVSLVKVIQPLTKNALLFKIAVITLTAAFVAYKIATLAATIATLALDVSLGPIILIVLGVVAAIAALVVVGVLLYKNWDRISALAGTVWAGVLRALKALWNWVKGNWPLLVGMLFGPFGLAAAYIITHFSQVKRYALAVINAIRGAIERLIGYVTGLSDKITGVLHKIPGAGYVGSAVGFLSRAEGGPVPYRSPVLVGERGPELLSLPGGSHVTPLPAGGRPIEVVVPVILDGREVARSVARVTADRLARK